ncbi:SCO4225 family membrane protein [Streptomyces sp. NPDC058694]|uniref:SCO4225 family membrane protein n=1 Tax=Streptomyces sp. NPDC058694 TaxID=3346603 RepID=UPI0036537261
MSSVTGGQALSAPFGTWPARLYLAVSAALIVWLAVVSSQPQADASFAAVIPILFTAPTSLLALAIPGGSVAWMYAVLAASAMVNAWLIDLVWRRLSSRKG